MRLIRETLDKMRRPLQRGPLKPWIVTMLAHNGTWKLYSRYATEKEASTAAARLCMIGTPAEFRDTRVKRGAKVA